LRSPIHLVLALCIAPSAALADVVRGELPTCPRGTQPINNHWSRACLGRPPESCPPGTKGEATRGGPLCAPLPPCADDAACGDGARCHDVGLCLATIDIASPDYTGKRIAARGVCGPNHECPEGSSCEVAPRCEAYPPPKRACECARPGATAMDPRPGMAFALVVALAVARRRRS
jgi:hypothetical protein